MLGLQSYLDLKWTFVCEEENVTASTSHSPDPDCQLLVTKGESSVKLQVEEVIGLFQTPSIRSLWDGRTDYLKVVRALPGQPTLVYGLTKSLWLLRPRDIVVHIHPTYWDADLGAFVITQNSVNDLEYPSFKGIVRAKVHFGAVLLFPRDDGVKVVTIGQLDIGGGYIPVSLQNIATRSAPLGMSKLFKFGAAFGIPPKLMALKEDGLFLKHELFDPKTFIYTLVLDCAVPITKRIRIDPKIYPSGPALDMKLDKYHIADGFLILSFPIANDISITISQFINT